MGASTIPLDFWSIIFLFSALQGFFLAMTLFFHQKGRKSSNRLLAFLLFIFSLHLTEYVMIISGFYQTTPYLIGITLPVVFLLGPIYYLYATSLLIDAFEIDLKRASHFIPAIICYLILLPFYAQPSLEKALFLSGIIKSGYVIFPLGQFVLLALSTVQMLAYFYLTFAFLNDYETNFKRQSANTEVLNIIWLKRISMGFSFYMVIFFVAYFQLFLLKAHRQEIFYMVMLVLALFIHVVAYNAIRQPDIFSGPVSLSEAVTAKYQKSALTNQQAKMYLKRLLEVMNTEKPFLNPELKLSDLAESLDILPNYLSQVINSELQKNFFDFVNEYRIQEAKHRLHDPEYLSLIHI